MWHPLVRLAAHRAPGRRGGVGRNGCSSVGRTLFVRPYTHKSSLPAVNSTTHSYTLGTLCRSGRVCLGTGCPERSGSIMLSCSHPLDGVMLSCSHRHALMLSCRSPERGECARTVPHGGTPLLWTLEDWPRGSSSTPDSVLGIKAGIQRCEVLGIKMPRESA